VDVPEVRGVGSWFARSNVARLRGGLLDAKNLITQEAERLANAAVGGAGTISTFLAQPDLLKWMEKVTESSASLYDKALDAEYLRTHLGGGNHRLFDGGHDLASAWSRVRDASEVDSFGREVVGYTQALWKDVTTAKGLPFATWDQESYGEFANTLVKFGVSKEWVYDLVSFDAFEVLSAGLGCAGLLFALERNDLEKLSELLGAMGITSILSANPLTGLAAIAVTAYAYRKKRDEGATNVVDGARVAKGAMVAGLTSATFALLGLPVLIELAIAATLVHLAKKHAGTVMDAAKQLVADVRGETTSSESLPARTVEVKANSLSADAELALQRATTVMPSGADPTAWAELSV
jgi:hypothetical protein